VVKRRRCSSLPIAFKKNITPTPNPPTAAFIDPRVNKSNKKVWEKLSDLSTVIIVLYIVLLIFIVKV
jgi:hypothetical protein